MAFDRLTFRIHAVQRMFEWAISEVDVRDVIENGEVIEEEPEDSPSPRRIHLGHCDGSPIHVVAADDFESQVTIIITVYRPDLARWEPGFRKRKQR